MLRASKEIFYSSSKRLAQLAVAMLLTASVAISLSPRVDAGWCKSEPAVSLEQALKPERFRNNYRDQYVDNMFNGHVRDQQVSWNQYFQQDKTAHKPYENYAYPFLDKQNSSYNDYDFRNFEYRNYDYRKFEYKKYDFTNFGYHNYKFKETPRYVDYDQLSFDFRKQLEGIQSQNQRFDSGYRQR